MNLPELLDNGAARARERARFLRRRGEGSALVEYHKGRAAAYEQVAALLRSDGSELYLRASELGTAPTFLGGPPHDEPSYAEGPAGRDDAAQGIAALEP